MYSRNLSTNSSFYPRHGYTILKQVVINTRGVDNTLRLYRGLNATGELIGVINTATEERTFDYGDIECPNGLFVVMEGGTPADVTVVYDVEPSPLAYTCPTGMWERLGLNYKSINKVDQDIPLLQQLGCRYLRVHIPEAPLAGWSESTNAEWRDLAKTLHDAGFHTTYGLSYSGALGEADWLEYERAVLRELAYCDRNNVCDEFQVGNELETPFSTAEVSRIIRDNVRSLASKCKLISDMTISYSAEHEFSTSVGHGSPMWAAEGKGDLDYLAVNTYGAYFDSPITRYSPTYMLVIPPLVSAFGDKWYISEFNVEDLNLSKMSADRRAAEFRGYMRYLKQINAPRAMFFQFRGYKDSDALNQLAIMRSDDTHDNLWLAITNT